MRQYRHIRTGAVIEISSELISDTWIPVGTQIAFDEPEAYTKKQLENMTKADILKTADSLGITLETGEKNTKAEIIAEFLAKQE